MIAAFTTFLTAWVYSAREPELTYEPGANSVAISDVFQEALGAALLAQPPGSALRNDLDERYDYLVWARLHQDDPNYTPHWPTWWDDIDDPASEPFLTHATINISRGAGTSSGLNDTSSGLVIAGGGCNADTSGSELLKCRTRTSQGA